MRKVMPAMILMGALAALPAFAAQATSKPAQKPATAPAHEAKSHEASHSTSGKVKSVDATSLVVSKGGKDMSFVLDSSTQKEGAIDVGADVTVRYHETGGKNMATAVMAKAAAKTKK